MLNRFNRSIFLVLSTCFILLNFSSCSKREQNNGSYYTQLQGEVFHTFYNMKYDLDKDCQREIDSVLQAFSLSLNPFQKGSLINLINENKTDSTDYMIRHIWTTAYRISQLSQGMYDVTASPMINAWGFGYEKGFAEKIDANKIDSLKRIVGYKKVNLENNRLIKMYPEMNINFSSISKGYASDLVGALLLEQGAKNYMVEIGGEIAFKGISDSNKAWRIGINKPTEDGLGIVSDVELIVNLQGQGGLATSGNYRNFHIINGKKYAHTINPITGYPSRTDVLSATVIAPSCMLADGLATACMVLGAEKAKELMKYYPEASYMFIIGSEDNYDVFMSKGFQEYL